MCRRQAPHTREKGLLYKELVSVAASGASHHICPTSFATTHPTPTIYRSAIQSGVKALFKSTRHPQKQVILGNQIQQQKKTHHRVMFSALGCDWANNRHRPQNPTCLRRAWIDQPVDRVLDHDPTLSCAKQSGLTLLLGRSRQGFNPALHVFPEFSGGFITSLSWALLLYRLGYVIALFLTNPCHNIHVYINGMRTDG